MELTNEFTVDVPVEEAWAVLTDLERIAPCMPGAALEEVEGDEYRGVVKVKVGPVTTQYRGKASFLERDADAHKAVLKAEGRETRGQGNASATITASLETAGTGTRVSVVTDLSITGRVAQMGRGVLADVSNKLLGQFVTSLESTVLAGSGPAADGAAGAAAGAKTGSAAPARGAKAASAPAQKRATKAARAKVATEGADAAPASGAPADAKAPAAAPATAPGGAAAPGEPASSGGPSERGQESPNEDGSQPRPAIRRIAPDREVAPVDLLEVAGRPLAMRIALPAAAIAVVLAILGWRRRRRG